MPAKASVVAPARSLLDHPLLQEGATRSRAALHGRGTRLTVDGLAGRASALAASIGRLGLRGVALHLDNGPDWVVIDLACQAAGVVSIPLPTFFSSEQLRHVLDTMPLDAVFTDRPDALAPLCAGRLEGGPDFEPEFELRSAVLLRVDPPRDPVRLPPGTGKVTFTSGSTGRPKGVCLSQAQLFAQAEALAAAVGLTAPRHLCALPLSTLLENVAGVYAPLLAGGAVIVPALADLGFAGSSSLDPPTFLRSVAQAQPTSLILTPQMLQLLVAAAHGGWQPPATLAFVAVGGARVPAGLVERAHALGIPAYEGYGLSECASVVSLNLPGAALPGSCGRPLPHLGIEIVDREIQVTGNAMLGYAGEPQSWAPQRIATGDLGALDAAGYLRIDGRRKNLLISSFGRNISPEWVESEVLADGALAECVVFGDARPHCVALVSPRDPQLPDRAIQQTIDRCNARLPDYARVLGWRRLSRPLAGDGELLTDNLRPRRPAIAARYGDLLRDLYRDGPPATASYARTA